MGGGLEAPINQALSIEFYRSPNSNSQNGFPQIAPRKQATTIKRKVLVAPISKREVKFAPKKQRTSCFKF